MNKCSLCVVETKQLLKYLKNKSRKMSSVLFGEDIVCRVSSSAQKSGIYPELGVVIQTLEDEISSDESDYDSDISEKVVNGTVKVSWYPSTRGYITKESEVCAFHVLI